METWISKARENVPVELLPLYDTYTPVLVNMAMEDLETYLGHLIARRTREAKEIIASSMSFEQLIDEAEAIADRLKALHAKYGQRREQAAALITDLAAIGQAALSAYISARIGVPIVIRPAMPQ